MSEQLLLTIIEASLRAFLLAALVGALLLVLRVPGGAPRHSAWLVVVVGMLAMPLLQRLTPALPSVPAPRVMDVAAFLPASPPPQPVSRIGSPDSRPVAQPPAVIERIQATSPSTTAFTSGPRISWLQFAGGAYGLIALTLLLRLAVALTKVRTLMRGARLIDDGLFELPSLATPVTVGVIRPRVVLPSSWKAWTATTREAVIAHERAHAKRRDPLVALLTRLNVCVFWFHPLAWWLERTLADAAEQACDDIAVRAVPQPRQYAETLLMMATASRQAGGRIAWAGVRAEGSGRLSERIDRILAGRHTLSVSRARRWLALAASATAVVVVIACRADRPVASLEPLVRAVSPETAAEIREGERRAAVWKAAHAMTWEQVAELEETWKRNREDLATLEKLLFFYEPDISGKQAPDDARKIAGRRPLILWFIEHHPDFEFHNQLAARIFGHTDWLMDPAGYEAAKKLWLAHAARPDVVAPTLKNAAWFLSVEDKPLAEQLLLQGRRQIPDDSWSAALGSLYAQAIVGSNRFTLGNVINSTDPAAARGEYPTRIRATLDTSRDPVLLSAAGGYLARNASLERVDLDYLALARTYLERAIQLDPKSERARYALDFLDVREQTAKEQRLFAGVPQESIPGVIARLPEDERLPILVKRAGVAYLNAESANWQATNPQTPDEKLPSRIEENRQEALASRQRSKKYAEDALALAKSLPHHPDQTDALFAATVALGANAFWDGDRETAVRHMLVAADVPPSTSGRLMSPTLNLSLEMKLIGALLKYGERDTVIEYFEKSAETRPAERERLLEAAGAIRNGKLPLGYERR
jgi:Zn-dependent protease with chaperone function